MRITSADHLYYTYKWVDSDTIEVDFVEQSTAAVYFQFWNKDYTDTDERFASTVALSTWEFVSHLPDYEDK